MLITAHYLRLSVRQGTDLLRLINPVNKDLKQDGTELVYMDHRS